MNRLLLAPLLIALVGCSSDIVVKTDLGEKFVVKKSAISMNKLQKKDLFIDKQEGSNIIHLNFMNGKSNNEEKD